MDSDLISRQAAIDALGEEPEVWVGDEYAQGLYQQWHYDVNALKTLPSAQPEIVRCRDCRFHENEQPGMVYCPAVVGGWVEDDWFCKGGERRTNE